MHWFIDDGINLPMINDRIRNQYYNTLLKDVVAGQDCIDIGFGTGLLSIIAVTHGANKITAYEKNFERYCLGKEIIKKSGLEHKIQLLNEQYHAGLTDSSRVKFCEIVSENLWSEGLWNCLPRDPDKNFYPGCYFLEIVDIPLHEDYMIAWGQRFSPGIDLPSSYLSTIQSLIDSSIKRTDLTTHIERRKEYREIYQKLLLEDNVCKINSGGYVVDVGQGIINYTKAGKVVSTTPINFNAGALDVELELDPAVPHALIPRVGMISNGHKLYLDQANCWGVVPGSKLIEKNNKRIVVGHHLHNGAIGIFGENKHGNF